MFPLNFPQREERSFWIETAGAGGWGVDIQAFFLPLTGCGIVHGKNKASCTRGSEPRAGLLYPGFPVDSSW